ncbi:MAG TPA: sigma-54 dependent transcriptional regulator [Saprospiraceae bacterium]|nr:sigma-54 dependent transcriptional regulator [Saprospiraceae bacterium]
MEGKTGAILMIDDNEDVLRAAKIFLKRHFHRVDVETNPVMIPTLMETEHYDVILLDMNFNLEVGQGQEGFYWLDRILKMDPGAVVVLITAYGDVHLAVKAIKEGATDFVLKPWENEKLLVTLNAAMNLRRANEELKQLKSKQRKIYSDLDSSYSQIIGKSEAMSKVFSTIEKVARTDANILIYGENGTGKELVARAIHRQSLRYTEPFVAVDLGSLPETLFESELFGYKKGAFTDAKEDKPGRIEMADKGTLFLDEISNISSSQQARLLRVLQTRKLTRLGSNKEIPFDIRLISATNITLENLVNEMKFRKDLMYRINTIEIHLPSLCDRTEDIPLLLDHYLTQYARKYKKEIYKVSDAAMKRLIKYHWPGNVRELQHAIERAVIMSNQPVLQPEDFFDVKPYVKEHTLDGNLEMNHLNIEDLERLLIRKALQKNNGNITLAAKELGLTRSSLYRRLEKYGI